MILRIVFVLISLSITTKAMVVESKISKFSVGQAINVPAIRNLFRLLRSPNDMVPNLVVDHISHIDPISLMDTGIKYVVFDKDNTLSAPYADVIHPSVVSVINQFKTCFPNRIAILSNSVGSSDDINYLEAEKVESVMAIPVIRHAEKKPGCLNEVIEHFKNKSFEENIDCADICVIGDRLLTDIVFANTNGMKSILVPALDNQNDSPIAVVLRGLERNCILPLVTRFCIKKKL